MPSKNPTVAKYIVGRLADLGICHVFGIPGDFSFSIDDAIEEEPRLSFILSANELNAAYAADGYARVCGAAILTTTYAVGELSALAGVMGSKAEHLPVFHLVGAPSTRSTRARHALHHSHGDGVTGQFFNISAQSACASALITPANCIAEMERVIAAAFEHRQPAYIQVPYDVGHMEVIGTPVKGVPLKSISIPCSVSSEREAAVAAIRARYEACTGPVIIASYKLARYGISDRLVELVDKCGIPFVITSIDKGVGPEDHPLFLGAYRGQNSSERVLQAVNNADLILNLGGVTFDDLSSGFCTARASRNAVVTVAPYCVTMMTHADAIYPKERSYSSVWMGDIIEALISMGKPPKVGDALNGLPPPPAPPTFPASNEIAYHTVQQLVESFLTSTDILFVETGTASLSFGNLRLPRGSAWHNQTLWGSIGWATPAAFGAAVAAPDRRAIVITGDGSHQLTANDIGAMGHYNAKPIILVLNNGVYGVEEFLELNKPCSYNDLAKWKYSKLPEAMGCKNWLSLTVTTETELADALNKARAYNDGVYIEVIMTEKLLPPMDERRLAHAYLIHPLLENE